MKKRYVLKNKMRFCLFIALVFASLFIMFSVNRVYGYKEPTYKTITVKGGDTLWSIASKYNNKRDIREYIYKLIKLNNLENSEIVEGSELKVIVE